VSPGDEVVVPANSFVATAEAVCLAGAVPRFADVDQDTQLVTAETIERVHNPRVCGVVPVHLFGRTVELGAIISQARRWGIWVVEDCAQAHGARYDGRRVGTWGDAGTFSFYPAKNLGAWGDGGAVVTARSDLAERVRLMRSHGERSRYEHRMVGTTARLDAIQAAVLERKLPRLESWNDSRRALAATLREVSTGLGAVQPPPSAHPPADHVYHQFVVRSGARDELRSHLAADGIASAIHYPVPIHRTAAFQRFADHKDVAPVASLLAREICSLPIFPSMSAAQIGRIGDSLRTFEPASSKAVASSI
jgi:dTDP-4-amino-4,6-dideoxygalactose transaminase